MADTAMSVAFEQIGWQGSEEKVYYEELKAAVDIWATYSLNSQGAARQNALRSRWQSQGFFVVVGRHNRKEQTQAASWLLERAMEYIDASKEAQFQREAQKQVKNTRSAAPRPVIVQGGGHNGIDAQQRRAPSDPSQDVASAAHGGGQLSTDTKRRYAPVVSDHARHGRGSEPANAGTAPSRLSPATPTYNREAGRIAAELRVDKRLNRLDTVFIDVGKPMRIATVAEVKKWASQRQQDGRDATRDWRFAMALCANLPSYAVIGDEWLNADEVETIYQKASLEYAA